METNLDINAVADQTFFEELREYIIGATDEDDIPPPPRPGMSGILVLAEQMRPLYVAYDPPPADEYGNLEPPAGWLSLHQDLCAAIDAVYGKDAWKDLDGGMGALNLGPSHWVDG